MYSTTNASSATNASVSTPDTRSRGYIVVETSESSQVGGTSAPTGSGPSGKSTSNMMKKKGKHAGGKKKKRGGKEGKGGRTRAGKKDARSKMGAIGGRSVGGGRPGQGRMDGSGGQTAGGLSVGGGSGATRQDVAGNEPLSWYQQQQAAIQAHIENLPEGRSILQAEVDAHSAAGDLWIVLYGRVFDLSAWKHPGGQYVLEAVAHNADATPEFADVASHFIHEGMPGLLANLCIGRLADGRS